MMRSKQKMLEMLDTIQEMFPNAKCELNHRNEFDLLIAVLLSAQCTDKLVNKVTAALEIPYTRRLCTSSLRGVTNGYSLYRAVS